MLSFSATRSRKSQAGISIPYLIGTVALLFIVGSAAAKMMASGPSATKLFALESAREIAASSKALSVELATLRLTYGSTIDPQISSGRLTSVSGLWPEQLAPAMGGSRSTGWEMSPKDRLIVGSEALLVAIAETQHDVCTSFNAISIRGATAPVVSSVANGSGGYDYSVSNAASVNDGVPTAVFCEPSSRKVFVGIR